MLSSAPHLEQQLHHIARSLIRRGAMQRQIAILILHVQRPGIRLQKQPDHPQRRPILGRIMQRRIIALVPGLRRGGIRLDQGPNDRFLGLGLRREMEGQMSPLCFDRGGAGVEFGEGFDE